VTTDKEGIWRVYGRSQSCDTLEAFYMVLSDIWLDIERSNGRGIMHSGW